MADAPQMGLGVVFGCPRDFECVSAREGHHADGGLGMGMGIPGWGDGVIELGRCVCNFYHLDQFDAQEQGDESLRGIH